MSKALIVIDYTYDFVADDGRLTCGKPGQQIESTICELTEQFLKQDQYVVVANDIHDPQDRYHPENSLFPPHNLAGTPGREPYGKLAAVIAEHRSRENIYLMPKTRYSAFAGTDLEIRLRERNITEIHLVGVCTDICVLHTAVDGYNRAFNLVVHADGVQSFNPTGHLWALNHFKNTLDAQICLAGSVLTDQQFADYMAKLNS